VLARDVARALGRPAVVPVPAFALKAALGEMSVAVLGGQRVLPKCALEAGYRFQHPELPEALRSLVG
jgi:NAD dependent epimerase/dehydratase family enzyme